MDTMPKWPRYLALVAGAITVASGLWALAAPSSFAANVASFDPYNQHFVQDIGAFNIGLGVVLLLPAIFVGADGLGLAMLGVGTGAAAHLLSHLIGLDLGGQPALDVPTFSILAAALVVGGVARLRETGASP